MNDDIFKSKEFWYTVAGGIVALNPALLVPIAGYFAAKAGCKGLGYAVEKSVKALTEAARRRRDRQAQEQWDREQPERDRKYKEEADRQAADQEIREDARAECAFLFSLLEPEISKRFSREQYEAFVRRYLNDSRPAKDVLVFADRLTHLMQQHMEKVQPSMRVQSVQALNEWYDRSKREIEAADINDPFGELRETQLYLLKQRYEQLMTILIEEMKP